MRRAGLTLQVGKGYSTVLPDMDFETYSEAGYVYREDLTKWIFPIGTPPTTSSGLAAVGLAVYAEDPSTEILSLAYDLKDGEGKRLWIPGLPEPEDLFLHIQRGGLIEAWNSAFEWHIWKEICYKRLGWTELPLSQTRDAMAKARAFSLPGALAKAGEAVGAPVLKDAAGKRLLNKFSKPRNPTKLDSRLRITPLEDLEDAGKLYDYNLQDIATESSISERVPDLGAEELKLWLLDQKINSQGVQVDTQALKDCTTIIEQAREKYVAKLVEITQGEVNSPSEIARIKSWLAARGLVIQSLTADRVDELLGKYTQVEEALEQGIPIPPTMELFARTPDCREVLRIRSSLGSASVNKVYAMDRQQTREGRLKELFAFCGASHTGRWAGRGPQPHNLPNSGPRVKICNQVLGGCGEYYAAKGLLTCPWCGQKDELNTSVEWGIDAVESALKILSTQDLDTVESFFGDAFAIISGSLRGMFIAAPGKDLICSDYSAIEAVVLAALAGEEWRLEVFRTHGMIYEASAARITGIPFQDFVDHKKETGEHHPLRKKVGKVAELASGYQGSVGAWKQFGAEEYLKSEDQILEAVKKWRAASPSIVRFWYDTEDAAKQAINLPGQSFEVKGISFQVIDDVLYVRLLSGRYLYYHSPILYHSPGGRSKITFKGVDSKTKTWTRLETYGGKLVENIVQGTARDILAHAMIRLDEEGYPIVLHVHDEIVAEVPEGWGSIQRLEGIMGSPPEWCREWPISAAGGWRGKRYRKD